MNRSPKLYFLNLLVCSLFLFVITADSQNIQDTANNTNSKVGLDSRVDPDTFGLNLVIQLGNYPGRNGNNVPVVFRYTSKVWNLQFTGSYFDPSYNWTISNIRPEYDGGWHSSLTPPRIEQAVYDRYDQFGNGVDLDNASQWNYGDPYYVVARMRLTTPDGVIHEMRKSDAVYEFLYGHSNNPNIWIGDFYSVDGSKLRYNTSAKTLYMPDGSRYLQDQYGNFNKLIDRNGNFLTYSGTSGGWTDTMGRIIVDPLASIPTTAQDINYSMPGMGTETLDYVFKWKELEDVLTTSQSLAYPGNCSLGSNGQTPSLFTGDWQNGGICDGTGSLFNPIVLNEIVLPNGSSYKFTYNIYGEIDKIVYPTGGYERFEHSTVIGTSYLTSPYEQANRGVINHWISSDGTPQSEVHWEYGNINYTTDRYTLSPDGTRSERKYQAMTMAPTHGFEDKKTGRLIEEKIYDSNNNLKRRTLYEYELTGANGVGTNSFPNRDSRPSRQISVQFENGSSSALVSMEEISYDSNSDLAYFAHLNPKQLKSYNFIALSSSSAQSWTAAQIAAQFSSSNLAKISEVEYFYNSNYKARGLITLVSQAWDKDGAGNVKAKRQIFYDETSNFPIITAGTSVQWENPNSDYRGNATTVRVWNDVDNNQYLDTHTQYDNFGNRRRTWDAKGNLTEAIYSSTYEYAYPTQIKTPVPDGTGTHGLSVEMVTSKTYDFNTGLTLTTTDYNGQETEMEYDDDVYRLTKVTAPNGAQTQTQYGVPNSSGQIPPNQRFVKVRTQIDDSHWSEGYTWFDGLSRTILKQSVESGGDVFVEIEYDSMGRTKRTTDPYRTGETKQWTTPTYDDLGRTVLVTLPDSSTVQTAFGLSTSSPVGTTKSVTDQAGRKRTGITDSLGRMVRVIEDPNGQNLTTDYLFDSVGNLRKTTQGSQYRYFMYDDLGRLLYAKHPEQEANTAFTTTDSISGNSQWSVKYEYDANSNITKLTDAEGVFVEGTYDNLNRLTDRNYSDSTPDVEFYYDGIYFDENDALQSAVGSVKGKATGIKSSVSKNNYINFDSMGMLLASQQITEGKVYGFSYNYNISGMLIEETYPSGRKVRNTFDQDGKLSLVKGRKNTSTGYHTYALGLAYNSSGALTKMRIGNGHWETYSYNNRLQVTQIGLGTTDGTQDLLKLEYTYNTTGNNDNNGSLLAQKITVPTAGSNSGFTASQSYAYDGLNRLQSATEIISNTPTWKQTFSYDRFGNRRFNTSSNNTTTINPSLPSKVTNPLINISDNRFQEDQDSDSVADYDYDKTGNLTLDAENRRFVYDAENRQKAFFTGSNNTSTPDATYYYDGEGRRVKKVSAAETTVFVYDGGGLLAAEYSTALAQTPQVSYLTADNLGSARIITNENGAVTKRQDYTAFGELVVSSQRTGRTDYNGQKEIRQDYTGYQKDDESSLAYAQARYYNASHGRFTSVDPLTSSGTIKDPQSFNRYSYVLNSPYNFTDPLGLKPDSLKTPVNEENCAHRLSCAQTTPQQDKDEKKKVPLPKDLKEAARKAIEMYSNVVFKNDKGPKDKVEVSGPGFIDFGSNPVILDELEEDAAFFYDRAVNELALFNQAVAAMRIAATPLCPNLSMSFCIETVKPLAVGETIDLSSNYLAGKKDIPAVQDALNAISKYNDYVRETRMLYETRRQAFINRNAERGFTMQLIPVKAVGIKVPHDDNFVRFNNVLITPQTLSNLYDSRVGGARDIVHRGH